MIKELFDTLIWPPLKREIDKIASQNVEEAIEYINTLLNRKELKWTIKDTALYYLKAKLIAKRNSLIRKLKQK